MQTRPIGAVMGELREWQSQSGLSFPDIAGNTGIHLSTIYRILSADRRPVRYGKALKVICKFANITIYARSSEAEVPADVRAAVLKTWDRSPEHARRLAAAVSALGELLRPEGLSK